MSKVGLRLALLLLSLPARALAQPADAASAGATPEQVSLSYSTEPGCPSEAEFVAEIMARVRRPVEWSAVGASVEMVVSVRLSAEGASGTLEVVQRSTEPTHREFTSGSCAEVSSALALVAALALDPNARTEQLPARPSTATAAPEEPVAPPPAASSPPAHKPTPTRPPIAPPASAAATPRAKPYLVWLGPTASVADGYASEPLALLGFAVGARSTLLGFSPGLQLTPLWGRTGTTGPATDGGRFSWLMGRLEACPVHLEVLLAPKLGFEPCAETEVGRLSARGDSAGITPDPRKRWWFVAGATFALHLSLGSWFVRLGGSASIPITRERFVFYNPDRDIHQANWVVVGASLGLGFQFGS